MKTNDYQGTPDKGPMPAVPLWKSRVGICVIVALGLGALLLGYEYRAYILASSWFLWLPLLFCGGMHFFMHGRHGGHGGRGSEDDKS